MAEIAWTDEAQRWLEDIFEYIAATTLKPPHTPFKLKCHPAVLVFPGWEDSLGSAA